jgi:hypothetical protein
VGRDDSDFVRDFEFLKAIDRRLHHFKIGFAPHDDADARAFQIFFHFKFYIHVGCVSNA